MFRPKLLDVFKTYSFKKAVADGTAGLVVGIVALPLAIAFAIASGVLPERGLYTAIIAGFLIAALGGNRVQIGGPTGAFVVIVYGIVQQHGYAGLVMATFMAGVILIIFGLAKLGSIIKFVPHPVIIGFTAGIAMLIFTGQINEALGLSLRNLPADFFEKMATVLGSLSQINPFACFITLLTLGTIMATGKLNQRVPGSLAAILLSGALVHFLKLPVETIGTHFGAMTHTLPAPQWPSFDFKTMQTLLGPAFTIAILGAIESLLSAVVADGMTGGRTRTNMELIAQGVANIASPIFGGIPATGAIARTATNIKSGGQTPVAGIVHALVLLLILLFLGQWVAYIPMACLAGILMVVAYHMSEWKSVRSIIKFSRSSALVAGATFALTVAVDLTIAIEIGLVLAALTFIRNMSLHTNVAAVSAFDGTADESEETEPDYARLETIRLALPSRSMLYEINGPLFFGAVYKFKEAIEALVQAPKILILDMLRVPVIDSSGVRALEETLKGLKKKGTQFVICGMQPQVYNGLKRAGVLSLVAEKNICRTLQAGLVMAQKLSE